MKTVGIRDLKNRLSEYLRQFRSGETLLVMDRGEVVAEFSPPGRALVDGKVPAEPNLYQVLPRRRRSNAIGARLLDEERGTR
jgi:antitoxin (DNA-binding transcriptional repressor) of toxin-antitoxin stability system